MNDDGKELLLPYKEGGPPDLCARCRHSIDDHGSMGCMRGTMNGRGATCPCALPVAGSRGLS